MPHKTQLESHLERVKYEIAQEFGLTQREDHKKQNNDELSPKKFKINKSKKLKIE